jgi:hypothetical protein
VVFRTHQEREALGEVRKKCGNRAKGYKAASRNALAAFVTLMDSRAGGFNEGCRNNAAMIYATLLRRNCESHADARRAILEMAKQCTPPLSVSSCDSTIKGVYKQKHMKHMSYHTMADLLDVAPAEAELICQVIGRAFPPAGRFGEWVPVTTQTGGEKRDAKRANRRAEIKAIIREHEAQALTPSYRAMAALLYERGIETSYATVMADYKALGIVSDGSANLRHISVARSQQPALALSSAC